mgnify:CR=1 FL=1
MKEKNLQIGLYIVSAMSILTGFVTLPSGGIVAVVSGIGGIILTVLLSKRTKELNKTINDKDYEIQCLNNSVVNNTTELVALKRHQEELGFTTYDETKAAADTLQKLIESYNQTIEKLRDSILEQTELSEKAEKRLKTAQNILQKPALHIFFYIPRHFHAPAPALPEQFWVRILSDCSSRRFQAVAEYSLF